jgi:hypothetical protein
VFSSRGCHDKFYQSLKSKVRLAAAKAAALRINLNVEGGGIVANLGGVGPVRGRPRMGTLRVAFSLAHFRGARGVAALNCH